ncbi:MAG: hypothetical protein Harvfovirus21_9 [Harvfovirus sp.]|uniref:Uncharacterized protein n=1 Tax=Harvfovirus sp. TaxID=2487768 RepID=A0A3G5A1Y7_9VIRU|nr:MAG: hypothetical protein Harvfovirus21_9 [Harvfovirus sp.]
MPPETHSPNKSSSVYKSPYGFEFGTNSARTDAILRALTTPPKNECGIYTSGGGVYMPSAPMSVSPSGRCIGPACSMGSSERSSRDAGVTPH